MSGALSVTVFRGVNVKMSPLGHSAITAMAKHMATNDTLRGLFVPLIFTMSLPALQWTPQETELGSGAHQQQSVPVHSSCLLPSWKCVILSCAQDDFSARAGCMHSLSKHSKKRQWKVMQLASLLAQVRASLLTRFWRWRDILMRTWSWKHLMIFDWFRAPHSCVTVLC